ncbi:MAG: helix-turn-helix domain-containing protein [Coriobacteriia bacterium]|nr:helix-turn-helix domain-containing protein [Coriobacteriia bacterium]
MPIDKTVFAEEITRIMKDHDMTRSELARIIGTDRATVARVLDPRDPHVSLATLSRVAAAVGREPAVSLVPERPSVLLKRHRTELRRIAASRGLTNVRVFGSVARGDDTPLSDLDLVADIPEDLDLLDVAAVAEAMSDVIGRRVDLAEGRALKPGVTESVQKESMLL